MFNADVTLDTTTYSLVSQYPQSSLRSDASQPVSEPLTMKISHETSKAGRRSSVILLTDTAVVTTGASNVKDDVVAMFKVQYNPFSGRTTNEADILALVDQLKLFLADPANIDKILNQES